MADVLEYVRGRYPDLPLDEKMILMIVNQGMTSPDTILKRNDTVSFLPAIGGG
ncbi:MAG: MoaD/ThiS family protein [Bacteroidetes bacterium]|nr:MoaD/ThiS family protein [Bacteroidota bacterium]